MVSGPRRHPNRGRITPQSAQPGVQEQHWAEVRPPYESLGRHLPVRLVEALGRSCQHLQIGRVLDVGVRRASMGLVLHVERGPVLAKEGPRRQHIGVPAETRRVPGFVRIDRQQGLLRSRDIVAQQR